MPLFVIVEIYRSEQSTHPSRRESTAPVGCGRAARHTAPSLFLPVKGHSVMVRRFFLRNDKIENNRIASETETSSS